MALECVNCGHKFGLHEAEYHEAEMTHIVIACPKCSDTITYQRVED